jgi:hypothetical protein
LPFEIVCRTRRPLAYEFHEEQEERPYQVGQAFTLTKTKNVNIPGYPEGKEGGANDCLLEKMAELMSFEPCPGKSELHVYILDELMAVTEHLADATTIAAIRDANGPRIHSRKCTRTLEVWTATQYVGCFKRVLIRLTLNSINFTAT